MQAQRLNITLPYELARDLRKTIPAKKRSKFIAQALVEKLHKKRNLKKEWMRKLRANQAFYKRAGKEITQDFQYADAEIVKRLP